MVRIRFGQEARAMGKSVYVGRARTRRQNETDWRPTPPDDMHQPHAIHRPGHADVAEDDVDVGPALQNENGGVGVFGFENGVAGFFKKVCCPHPDDLFIVHDKDDGHSTSSVKLLRRLPQQHGKRSGGNSIPLGRMKCQEWQK
jgi:hypothetical protein